MKTTILNWLSSIKREWLAWLITVIALGIAWWITGTKPDFPPIPDVPILPEVEQKAQQQGAEATKIFQPDEAGEILICGRTESISDRERFVARPWPVRKITWHVRLNGFTGLRESEVLEAFRVAWASYAKRIDIEPTYVNNESEAMVLCQFGDIDGSGKVLAWSELSNGTITQKHQLYDRKERWEISSSPKNIDLIRVAAHELGHVLGLDHDVPNSGNLMQPAYSRSIQFPTDGDAKRLVALGYAPAKKEVPVIPAPPMPGGGDSIPIAITIPPETLVEALRKAGYSVEKK